MSRQHLVASCLVVAAAVVACSGEGGGGAANAVSAFTVSNGDRFVVSATPEHIVLRKNVDGAVFPFDEASLLGKALLIHPVAGRADAGVYARATSVTTAGDTYEIESVALTLPEMAKATEDEIVRIYVDPSKVTGTTPPAGPTLTPQSFFASLDDHTLHTSALGTLTFLGGGTSVWYGLNRPVFMGPGLAVTGSIQDASFIPDLLADYTDENGLELGMRVDMEWRSTLAVKGKFVVQGEFFRSEKVTSPPFVFVVPIGPVPVPVSITAAGSVMCSVAGMGDIDASLDIDVGASLGGSVYVNPGWSSPGSWLSEGSWPASAGGHASVTPHLMITPDDEVVIGCAVPRIDIEVLVAGVAGPYLAVVPTVSYSTKTGPGLEYALRAGVEAKFMGASIGAEKTLVSWKPWAQPVTVKAVK